jgi:hypothetical protein
MPGIDERRLAEAGSDARAYFEIHRRRYELLLEVLRDAVRKPGPPDALRILDVGQSLLTVLVREAFPGAVVNTLGHYDDGRYRDRERHFTFDLNRAASREEWPDIGRYHVVILAEVLEHLYTAPQLVLGFFAAALEPEGCLVLQTPNAASLSKRLKLAAGRNPYEMIREDRSGHFREYTVAELAAAARGAGLLVERVEARNYFRFPSLRSRVVNALGAVLPGTFREGITMLLRKSAP